MDKKRLQEFGHRLEARRQELRQSVAQKQQYGRAVDGVVSPDVIDRAASAYDKDFLFRQSTQQKQMLQTVEEALQRIREGSFGLCLSCGNDITPPAIGSRGLDPLLRRVPRENGTTALAKPAKKLAFSKSLGPRFLLCNTRRALGKIAGSDGGVLLGHDGAESFLLVPHLQNWDTRPWFQCTRRTLASWRRGPGRARFIRDQAPKWSMPPSTGTASTGRPLSGRSTPPPSRETHQWFGSLCGLHTSFSVGRIFAAIGQEFHNRTRSMIDCSHSGVGRPRA